MTKARKLPYPCRCGGPLVEAPIHVEHLGIDFGVRTGHVCTRCGDEFLTDEVWQEVEDRAKEAGLFGLEKKVEVRKSGNSLVVTLPPKIAKYLGIRRGTTVSLAPSGKGRLEIEVV